MEYFLIFAMHTSTYANNEGANAHHIATSSSIHAPNPAPPQQPPIVITIIMATKTEDKQISALYWECIEAFRRLFKHIQEHGVNGKKVDIPGKLTGAPGQLQVWAENVGAHRRNSRLSLDYKLREASRYRAHVKVLLGTIELLTGELKPPQKNNDPESSEQDATDTDPDSSDDEREEDVITANGGRGRTFYILPVSTHGQYPESRLQRPHGEDREKSIVFCIGPFDINHHHDKIAGRRKDDTGNPGNTDSTAGAEADHQDEKGEGSTTMQTTVSTVHEGNVPGGFENHEPDDDARSDTGFSETSYATSAGSSFSSDKLRVPPPPNGYSDEPFQCPYYVSRSLPTKAEIIFHGSKKHVFRDIRPYVCTFRKLFPGNTSLFRVATNGFITSASSIALSGPAKHCQEVSSSSQSFKDHITKTHRHLLRTESMAVLVDRSIALFILPGSLQEDEEDEDDDEDDGGSAASD
ncbi:hypothetical protein BZA77DRAFT_391263 [Pyronema omphalodes]|nr:hypothetical protein BZA77DRAFT_391263 [Pyronema omphalodes]